MTTEELTLEEAGELVLEQSKLYPWMPCVVCKGRGETGKQPDTNERIICVVCHSAGYLLSPKHVAAYKMLNVALPSKPKTRAEVLELVGESFRKTMNSRSSLMQMFPPQLLGEVINETVDHLVGVISPLPTEPRGGGGDPPSQ